MHDPRTEWQPPPRREAERPARIAVIGDVHQQWDAGDVAYFNRSDYDLVLFVGDLAGYTHRGGLRTARAIARLNRPALVLPGNHDAVHPLQLLAEVMRFDRLAAVLGAGQDRRCRALAAALGPVPLCGFSLHELPTADGALSIIAARPHTMGGSYVAFRRHLRRSCGVASVADAAERLRALVDESPHGRLVFLAHCGPTGFGARRDDIWGCDFHAEEGDWGDRDLTDAVAYAVAQRKRVLAVVAGHMHHEVKGGGRRRWWQRRDGITYVNAARVPRIFADNGDHVRHHVALEISGDEVAATEMLVRGIPRDDSETDA